MIVKIARILMTVTLFYSAPAWPAESPRMRIHLVVVHPYYGLSVPWDLDNPEIIIPLNLPNTRSGAASFLGHVKDTGQSGDDVVGGDLMIRMGHTDRTYPDIWKERLVEAGYVDVDGSGADELYFLTMEGDLNRTMHFNLLRPLTSKLITLSCSWGPDDRSAVFRKSDNFDTPAL